MKYPTIEGAPKETVDLEPWHLFLLGDCMPLGTTSVEYSSPWMDDPSLGEGEFCTWKIFSNRWTAKEQMEPKERKEHNEERRVDEAIRVYPHQN